MRCADCDLVLDENPAPREQRQPCPRCGSLSRVVEATATVATAAATSAMVSIPRTVKGAVVATSSITASVVAAAGAAYAGFRTIIAQPADPGYHPPYDRHDLIADGLLFGVAGVALIVVVRELARSVRRNTFTL